jgi:DNA-binding transcriptional ArsR family regulator
MSGAGSKDSPHNRLDRILHALNHPIRRQIIGALAEEAGSATTLSRRFKIELGVLSYHLNQVLAQECDLLELVEVVPKRGAVEKFYRLKSDVFPTVEMADAGLKELADGACDWFSVKVDPDGRREIDQARAEFGERVATAVDRTHARSGGEGEGLVVSVTAISAGDPSCGA